MAPNCNKKTSVAPKSLLDQPFPPSMARGGVMVPSWAAETIRARRLLPAAARPWRRFPRRSSRAHLWTWGGSDFGYRDGDELWTYDGRHVGRFQGQNVFGIDGQYLGELRGDDRLI